MASFQTLDNIFEDVRAISGKDVTTLSDGNLLRIANKYYLSLVRELVSLNEDLYAEISSADLVANQREYSLPGDDTTSTFGGGLIKLQRVEVTYDGTNWRVAFPTSLQEITGPTILDSDLNAQYDQSNPVYWFKDRSVWIAPVPKAAITAGLRIFWIERPDEMAGTADIPELPKDFLGLLSEGMLYDVYRTYNRTTEARDALQNWYGGIERMKMLEQGIDQEQIYRLKAYHKRYS